MVFKQMSTSSIILSAVAIVRIHKIASFSKFSRTTLSVTSGRIHVNKALTSYDVIVWLSFSI